MFKNMRINKHLLWFNNIHNINEHPFIVVECVGCLLDLPDSAVLKSTQDAVPLPDINNGTIQEQYFVKGCNPVKVVMFSPLLIDIFIV